MANWREFVLLVVPSRVRRERSQRERPLGPGLQLRQAMPSQLGTTAMCRNVHHLFNFVTPATKEEFEAAALKCVRKITGMRALAGRNALAFLLAQSVSPESPKGSWNLLRRTMRRKKQRTLDHDNASTHCSSFQLAPRRYSTPIDEDRFSQYS